LNQWALPNPRIIIDGKCKWLGYFENEYDAYLAYKKELDNLGNNV